MSFPWFPYVVGLLLGLIPPRLFYNSNWRHVALIDATTSGHLSSSGRHRTSSGFAQWWTLPLIWVDPIRGFFAAHLIAGAVYTLPMEMAEQVLIVVSISTLSTLAILSVQMEFGRQRAKDLLSPAAFLFGYLIGLYPGSELMGASVAVIGLIAVMGTKNFTAGYLAAGAAALFFGYRHFGLGMSLGVFAVTAAAPVPYAFLRRARLVVPVRR